MLFILFGQLNFFTELKYFQSNTRCIKYNSKHTLACKYFVNKICKNMLNKLIFVQNLNYKYKLSYKYYSEYQS